MAKRVYTANGVQLKAFAVVCRTRLMREKTAKAIAKAAPVFKGIDSEGFATYQLPFTL